MPVRTERHLANNYKSFSTMQHFSTRAFRLPALLVALLGVMLGRPASAQQISPLMYFDGVSPTGRMVEHGGGLYGATTGGGYAPGGLLYRLALDSSSINTIYEYGRLDVWTGATPGSGLLYSSDGFLYGVTQYNSIDILRGGSPVGNGTLFRVSLDGRNYAKLYDFDLLTRDSRGYLVNTSGAPPQAALIEGTEGGVRFFYGTTFQGGQNGTGTVFKVHTDGTAYQVLHDFGAAYLNTSGYYDFAVNPDGRLTNADGVNPNQRLTLVNGYLYGVTTNGGLHGTGVVFKIRTDGTDKSFAHFDTAPYLVTESTNQNFDRRRLNTTGAYPAGGLVLGGDGMLYGTASAMGGLASPRGTGGYVPVTTPTPDPDPNLVLGHGVLFRIDPNAPLSNYQARVDTDPPIYPYPTTQAEQDTNPRAFPAPVDPDTIQPVVLFTGATGANPGSAPSGDLIVAADGMLVGTTQSGGVATGSTGAGTVFRYQLGSAAVISECVFTLEHSGTHGATPISGVIQTADGSYYGTTYQGGYGSGLIFKCGTPHGVPPLGIRPPLEDDGGGSLPFWMIAMMATLLAVQIARRRLARS